MGRRDATQTREWLMEKRRTPKEGCFVQRMIRPLGQEFVPVPSVDVIRSAGPTSQC